MALLMRWQQRKISLYNGSYTVTMQTTEHLNPKQSVLLIHKFNLHIDLQWLIQTKHTAINTNRKLTAFTT